MSVKRFIALTITLCTAATVALSTGGIFALADDSSYETEYPETFIEYSTNGLNSISDYAVSGTAYAFAEDETVTVIDIGKAQRTMYEIGSTVTALDCKNGVFYYATGEDKAFSLPEKVAVENFDFTEYDFAKTDGGIYKLVNGKLGYNPNDQLEYVDIAGSYSKLKCYDGSAYAISGNKLYKFVNTTAEQIDPSYIDFSSAAKIHIGNTVKELFKACFENPRTATLQNGEYLTKVYLDEDNFDKEAVKSNDYFKVGKTFKVGEDAGYAEGQVAILLCKTGNADIISFKGDCYLKQHIEEAVKEVELAEGEFEKATFNVPPFEYLYSVPVMNEATRLRKINFGDFVKVEGKVLKSDFKNELASDFYKVTLTDENGEPVKDKDGNDICGYVPCSFIYEKPENGGAHETPDPEPNESDLVRTVVLILVVVILLLIAIGYITYICTRDKTKKNKKNKQ